MPQGNLQFIQLNSGWNADPNVPLPRIELDSGDLLLIFRLNAFQFANFREDDLGILRFVSCTKYHLGGPNDEGWYLGQCRFSKLAPAWGEFYRIQGETFGLASISSTFVKRLSSASLTLATSNRILTMR